MTVQGDVECVDAKRLRHARQSLAVPFRVQADDGETISVSRLLRVLPGKRIVGEANWRDTSVLVKLFVARANTRHWERERQGIAALQAANLPTPAVVGVGRLEGGGHFLLTEFLAGSRTLAERWMGAQKLRAGDPRALEILLPAFALLGRLHAAGLIQTDLHLGNFLEHQGELFLIDGDGIEPVAKGVEAPRQTLDNLALLVAQLPLAWESCLDVLIAAYGANATCCCRRSSVRANSAWRISSARRCAIAASSPCAARPACSRPSFAPKRRRWPGFWKNRTR